MGYVRNTYAKVSHGRTSALGLSGLLHYYNTHSINQLNEVYVGTKESIIVFDS